MSRPGAVVATRNPQKLREIREIAGGALGSLRSLEEFPAVELPTEGSDYEANALGKARAVARATARHALGDDSGLEVDALDGGPGPLSARYGGPGLDDAGRVRTLLAALDGVPEPDRAARFVCVVAWCEPGGMELAVRGECRGRILAQPRGAGGFGYDPVFLPAGEERSMAELPAERKNVLSHRARALRTLLQRLAT